jgi:hypothetical protein
MAGAAAGASVLGRPRLPSVGKAWPATRSRAIGGLQIFAGFGFRCRRCWPIYLPTARNASRANRTSTTSQDRYRATLGGIDNLLKRIAIPEHWTALGMPSREFPLAEARNVAGGLRPHEGGEQFQQPHLVERINWTGWRVPGRSSEMKKNRRLENLAIVPC